MSSRTEKLKATFRVLDTDGDSMLDFDEIAVLLKKLKSGLSNQQMQKLFVKMDRDRSGAIDMDEFVDYIVEGKLRVPDSVLEPPQGTPSTNGIREEWKQATLDAHNRLRAQHGVPPLTWNDECYLAAKRRADTCQAKGGMEHGDLQGPSGRHGQNIFWCSRPGSSADRVAQSWYDEITDPGYDFQNPGFTHGTGHFTQVVWRDTRSVGMAVSEDGCFVVANYFPAGNMNMPGYFEL